MPNIIDASVIITTYGRVTSLKRAIKSVVEQKTQYTFEIIVVDDNGLDNDDQHESAKVVDGFKGIIYLPLRKNSGACISRNEGIKIANGKYIFFLDDDDKFLPDKIQSQITYLQLHSHLDGCLAAFYRFDQQTNQEIIADSNYPIVGDFVNFVNQGNFFTPMLVVKTAAVKKIGGFDDIPRFQDRYLMLKALEEKLTFDCINTPLHVMYEHSGKRITSNNIEKGISALDKIREKIVQNRYLFTEKQWKRYLIKDNRMRGTILYVSNKYLTRILSTKYFFKAFCLSYSRGDLGAIIKAFLRYC